MNIHVYYIMLLRPNRPTKKEWKKYFLALYTHVTLSDEPEPLSLPAKQRY